MRIAARGRPRRQPPATPEWIARYSVTRYSGVSVMARTGL